MFKSIFARANEFIAPKTLEESPLPNILVSPKFEKLFKFATHFNILAEINKLAEINDATNNNIMIGKLQWVAQAVDNIENKKQTHLNLSLLYEEKKFQDAATYAEELYKTGVEQQIQLANFLEKCALAYEEHTLLTVPSASSPQARTQNEEAMKMLAKATLIRRAIIDTDPALLLEWRKATNTGQDAPIPAPSNPGSLRSKLANVVSNKEFFSKLGESLINLSCILHRLEKRDEAMLFLKKALAVFEIRVYPKQDHEMVATCFSNLGVLSDVHLNDKEEAVKWFRRAIEMRQRLYADIDGYHENLADSLHALGAALERLGQRYEGVKTQLDAANKYRGIFHSQRGNTKVASALNSIGIAVERYGDVKIGIILKRDALKMLRELFPHGNSELVASVCDSLGVSLEQAGESDEGVRLKREGLAMRQLIFAGRDHADHASSLNNVGGSLERAGERNKGLELRRKACAMYERLYEQSGARDRIELPNGERPASINVFDLNLVQSYATVLQGTGVAEGACGDKDRGVALQLRALELCQRVFGEQSHPQLASAYSNAGSLYYTVQKDKVKGIAFIRKALAMRRKLYGVSANSLTIESVVALLRCDILLPQEGMDLADEFLPMLRKLSNSLQKPQMSYFLTAFAGAYERWGHLDIQGRFSLRTYAETQELITSLHSEARQLDSSLPAERIRTLELYGLRDVAQDAPVREGVALGAAGVQAAANDERANQEDDWSYVRKHLHSAQQSKDQHRCSREDEIVEPSPLLHAEVRAKKHNENDDDATQVAVRRKPIENNNDDEDADATSSEGLAHVGRESSHDADDIADNITEAGGSNSDVGSRIEVAPDLEDLRSQDIDPSYRPF